MPYPRFWTSAIFSGARQSPKLRCKTSRVLWIVFTAIGPFSRRLGSGNLDQRGSPSRGSTHSSTISSISSRLAPQMACALRSRNQCISVLSRNPGEDPVVSRRWNRFYSPTNGSANSLPSEDRLRSAVCYKMTATCPH